MVTMIKHTFSPVFNKESNILILGTFPSVVSREHQFYYSHPQNRFWKVIAALVGENIPDTIEEKTQLLLKHGIAVWDVIKSCEIEGSSDSSIKNVIPMDLSVILEYAPIQAIYANGSKAYELYKIYSFPKTKQEIVKLPSTSSANARYSFEKLVECWSIILN